MNVSNFDKFPGIFQVEGFQEEFDKAVSETKIDGRYHRWLRKKLCILKEQGTNALLLPGFEKLTTGKKEPNLYAIRYPKSKKNPRVTFFYFDGEEVCLLHTFLEKSKSDYDSGIEISLNRLRKIQF